MYFLINDDCCLCASPMLIVGIWDVCLFDFGNLSHYEYDWDAV